MNESSSLGVGLAASPSPSYSPSRHRKSMGSINSLSIAPEFDLASSNHLGPKPVGNINVDTSADLMIPQYPRANSPKVPSSLIIIQNEDGLMSINGGVGTSTSEYYEVLHNN